MAYLVIDGVTVRVAQDSVSMRYVGVSGEEERSPSGSLEGSPLVLKREWAMATTPVPGSEVDAWCGLLEGKGHAFPFNTSLYSSRGRGPYYFGTAALITSGAKHGAAYVRVGTADSVTYRNVLGTSWTVMLWRLESGVWRHYLVTSGGHRWKDGVRNDALATTAFVDVVSGELRVGDFGGATGIRDFDSVVALPYVAPDAWAPLFYTRHAASAWASLPRAAATGDFSASAVTVRGKVTDSRVLRYAPDGTLTAGYTIQFTLREV